MRTAGKACMIVLRSRRPPVRRSVDRCDSSKALARTVLPPPLLPSPLLLASSLRLRYAPSRTDTVRSILFPSSSSSASDVSSRVPDALSSSGPA